MTRRVALITGGSSGIGLATGRLLVEGGYEVVLNARRPEVLAEAAASIGARAVAGDCSDPDTMSSLVNDVGRIDLLVHSAGMLGGTWVRKETLAGFDALITANLRSAFVTTNAVLQTMEAGGRIVFLSSSSAHQPHPARAAYSASKAGLNAFAAALAAEVERDGIAVHVVTPAPVDTPMLDDVRFPVFAMSADDVAKAIVWLDKLSPGVVLPELVLRTAESGPFAPERVVPPAAKDLGRG